MRCLYTSVLCTCASPAAYRRRRRRRLRTNVVSYVNRECRTNAVCFSFRWRRIALIGCVPCAHFQCDLGASARARASSRALAFVRDHDCTATRNATRDARSSLEISEAHRVPRVHNVVYATIHYSPTPQRERERVSWLAAAGAVARSQHHVITHKSAEACARLCERLL